MDLLARDLAAACMAWDISHRLSKVAKVFPSARKRFQRYAVRLESVALTLAHLACAMEYLQLSLDELETFLIRGPTGLYNQNLELFYALARLVEEYQCCILERKGSAKTRPTSYLTVSGKPFQILSPGLERELEVALQKLETGAEVFRSMEVGVKNIQRDGERTSMAWRVFEKPCDWPPYILSHKKDMLDQTSHDTVPYIFVEMNTAEPMSLVKVDVSTPTVLLVIGSPSNISRANKAMKIEGQAVQSDGTRPGNSTPVSHASATRPSDTMDTISTATNETSAGRIPSIRIFGPETAFTTAIDYGRPKVRHLSLTADSLELHRGTKTCLRWSLGVGVLLAVCYRGPYKNMSDDAGNVSLFFIRDKTEVDLEIQVIKFFLKDDVEEDTLVAMLAGVSWIQWWNDL